VSNTDVMKPASPNKAAARYGVRLGWSFYGVISTNEVMNPHSSDKMATKYCSTIWWLFYILRRCINY